MFQSKVVGKLAAGAVALGLLGGVFGGSEARADRRHFPFTYDWRQPVKGEKELELNSRYRGRNNTFTQQVEFAYGITDRWSIAPYLVFENGRGQDFEFTEWKLQTRYQLGDYKAGRWLPGLYAEYIGVKGGADEAEGKLILSRYGKDGSDISFNYIIEKELENGAEFENVYSVGYSRPLGNGKDGFLTNHDVRGGVEWIHNLQSGRINAGPVLGLAVTDKVWVVGGWALPVNSRGGNKSEFRLLAEYEW